MRFYPYHLLYLFSALVFLPGCASNDLRTPFHVSESAEGMASWYGPGFEGKPTASGELFDRSKLTAAHRALPFQSLVRVTNKVNGKSVEVRINDRGPFTDDRIIDLSSLAADYLQMKKAGTVPVKILILRLGAE